jgi:uncharacterized protein (TIGR00299 family) protein
MKSLFFDVVSGASGDMILSSLIDIGVPLDYLRKELGKMPIPGFSIDVQKQKRSGITASHLVLNWDSPKAYRHIQQILDMITAAQYPSRVLDRCKSVLMRLGAAEAKVHGIPLEKVHFHEIGAIDTIVDIAGICLSLEYLGVDEIHFSALTDGKGSVTTAHGVMPIPVPAVAEMIQGFSMRILDVESELLTPTGCAVLTALGKQVLTGFHGIVEKTGYGCGTKIIESIPNMLRVFLINSAEPTATDKVVIIETDMDHVTGEILGNVAQLLMDKGALDVSYSPLFMKKGRPGYRLTVVCSNDKKQELIDLILLHTRTLGVRFYNADRVIWNRTTGESTIQGEPVAEKICEYKGTTFFKPEYESLARISEKTGVPVIELMEKYIKEKTN